MLSSFSTTELFIIALIFLWTGFVRTGLGFGGAALGLPLLLLVHNQLLYWLPIIGTHLLFFTSLTLRTRLHNVNWQYLGHSSTFIVPAALAGVMGLLNLPNEWLIMFVYALTLFYAVMWLMDFSIRSQSKLVDRLLLITGGYVAGTSLTGAPLLVAVYMRNVSFEQLRNTLFVLWFILVSIKMGAFAVLSVDLQLWNSLLLLPVAAIGHILGLKVHDKILQNDRQFKQLIGGVLVFICILGLLNQT